jgi:hypothetical protein
VATLFTCREVGQTWSFRGTKSRNKVTVGEPAVGSLLNDCFQVVVPALPRVVELLPESTNTLCTVQSFRYLCLPSCSQQESGQECRDIDKPLFKSI